MAHLTRTLFGTMLLLWGTSAAAEFMKTAPFTYQNSNGELKVIAVPETEEKSGIFVVNTPPEPLQLFDPESKDFQEVESLFIEFDKRKRRFVQLYLGENAFEIRGSFTLFIGKGSSPKLSLDQSSMNPYLTILSQDQKSGSSVLAFLGVLEVVNQSGENAHLFEAHSFGGKHSDAIQPYRVLPGGKLFLGDTEVTVEHVGLSFEQKTLCLDQDAVVLSPENSELRTNTTEKELLEIVKLQLRTPFSFENLLPLRTEKNEFWGLDYLNGEILKVTFKKRLQRKGKTVSLCTSEKLTSTL